MRQPRRVVPRGGLPTIVPLLVLALAAFTALPASATITNGNFDLGLSGWTTDGDVTGTAEAIVGDNGALYSLLYQPVPLAAGPYRLEFDFLNLLSSDLSADPFAFPDSLFASLYFVDNLASFDLANAVFDDVLPLMDLDAGGAFNAAGILTPSALGGNWAHFAIDFTQTFAYAIPAFELLDLNYAAGDSQVWIDNVSIAPLDANLPEPATATLALMGLATCAATAARKKFAPSK